MDRALCGAHDVAESTWAKYQAHLHNHLLPRFCDTPLADTSHITIKQWVKELRRQLTDATASDIVSILSMILAEAVDEDHIGKNPCRHLKLNLRP
ncbi:hypothetical protein HUO13_10080 [Saccharopolyspora erythraea]|uniref:hypothetical protein n=1 Tax=Saccharopolyspora erythraea TaxID=1836 RepID=UPI001BA778DA|nr:hypothetical protein HUO13_10080 [Saccharopolyspora erythraea]